MENGRILADDDQGNALQGYGVPEFAENGAVASVIFHDGSDKTKQRFTYLEWADIPGLGLFPRIAGLSDSIPVGTSDDFEVVSEVELLEFRPEAPDGSSAPFHYREHIQEDSFEKYVHIGNIQYHLSGTNLVPVITIPPSKNWNAAIMAIFLLGILAVLFLEVFRERKNSSNKHK